MFLEEYKFILNLPWPDGNSYPSHYAGSSALLNAGSGLLFCPPLVKAHRRLNESECQLPHMISENADLLYF